MPLPSGLNPCTRAFRALDGDQKGDFGSPLGTPSTNISVLDHEQETVLHPVAERGETQEYVMAGSGSETRQRPIILKARFTEQEATLVKQQADAAGLSVSALIRFALLDQKPVRASRTPPLDREMAARLLAALGPMACAMRKAAEAGDDDHLEETIIAAQCDLAELRVAIMSAFGRMP